MEDHNHWDTLKQADIYSRFRPSYEDVVLPWILEFYGKESLIPLAVDVGCGPGQITASISPYCERVVGLDISEAMLTTARSHRPRPNVEYRIGNSSDFSKQFSEESVDLITAGFSFQYFDPCQFFAEVEKVLKPGGGLVLVGYMARGFAYPDREDLRFVTEKFYRKQLLPEFAKRVTTMLNFFADIDMPYKESAYKKEDFTVSVTHKELKYYFMANPLLFIDGEAGIDDFVSTVPEDDTLPMTFTTFGQLARK